MFAVKAKMNGGFYNQPSSITFDETSSYSSALKSSLLHGPSMFAVKAKIYGAIYYQSSSIAFDETSSYWSALKKLLISRLFIDHHTVV